MFTGLIEDVGTLRELRRQNDSAHLTIATALPTTELRLGDSVAVNGVCLTVTRIGAGTFEADASPETLSRSNLGRLRPGAAVNLERALRVGDRLGGHFVSGHVDGLAQLSSKEPEGQGVRLTFRLAAELSRLLVIKGSVAVDGVSLTVNALTSESFAVTVIPHSLGKTTLRLIRPGDPVNIEGDLIGKYVERFLALSTASERPAGLGLETLAKHGFL